MEECRMSQSWEDAVIRQAGRRMKRLFRHWWCVCGDSDKSDKVGWDHFVVAFVKVWRIALASLDLGNRARPRKGNHEICKLDTLAFFCKKLSLYCAMIATEVLAGSNHLRKGRTALCSSIR